jgi:hypothetical protein
LCGGGGSGALFFIVFKLSVGPEKGEKKSQVHLNVTQKLEFIEKLESGVSVAVVYVDYRVEKQTVSVLEKHSQLLRNIHHFLIQRH